MGVFCINDKVIHFREGLSSIVDKKEMNGSSYFLVKLERSGGEIIYVPELTAEKIIRCIISKEQFKELVSYMKTISPEYITNTKQRRDNFKRRLTSGNIQDTAYLARQLYFFYHPEILKQPVKFGPADLEMLKYASRSLFDELAIACKKDRDEIEEFVFSLV